MTERRVESFSHGVRVLFNHFGCLQTTHEHLSAQSNSNRDRSATRRRYEIAFQTNFGALSIALGSSGASTAMSMVPYTIYGEEKFFTLEKVVVRRGS